VPGAIQVVENVGSMDADVERPGMGSQRFSETRIASGTDRSQKCMSSYMPEKYAKEKIMSTVKVIEVLAESEKSWEHAAQAAVQKASESLHNINSIYISNMEAKVADNKITEYRISAKISFTLD
jgi:hypothetical protein